jgi:C-terminal processing protease CtpA/Prc
MRIIVTVIIIVFMPVLVFADTLIMKDGNRIKGLVIEEYVDRVALNTIDGEKNIFRKDIETIEYDTPEQNFMQLGRNYDDKGWYDKAVFYYKKAMEINPDYKDARESYLAAHSKLWRRQERMTKKEMERQNIVMDWRRNKNNRDISPSRDKAMLLENVLGLSLIEENGIFIINKVRPNSSAGRTGVKNNDILVSIWGKLVKYSKMEDVIDALLGPKYSEVRIVIEKIIPVLKGDGSENLYKELGILLDMEYEGLIIKDLVPGKRAELSGLEKGDLIIAVDNNITRYISKDQVIRLINNSGDKDNVILKLTRTVNLRREGE